MTTTSSRSKKRRSSKSRSRRQRSGGLFIWLFLGVLVVLFVIIAFISRSNNTSTSDGAAANVDITPAEVAGGALPEHGQEPDAAVGQSAPTMSGTSIDGEPIKIEPGDGTPKAIAFLAHWCPHCQREVPTVVDWAANGGVPDGVEVLGVATGIDNTQPNYPPHTWFEREEWDFPTLVDGNTAAARAYGLATYPYWVLVDGEGNVVQRWSGETTPEQLDERIGQLAQAGS